MQRILADVTSNIAEFTRNPMSVLREAKGHPVAVLDCNKPVFYVVDYKLFEVMAEEISKNDLCKTLLSRISEKAHAIEIDIGEV